MALIPLIVSSVGVTSVNRYFFSGVSHMTLLPGTADHSNPKQPGALVAWWEKRKGQEIKNVRATWMNLLKRVSPVLETLIPGTHMV